MRFIVMLMTLLGLLLAVGCTPKEKRPVPEKIVITKNQQPPTTRIAKGAWVVATAEYQCNNIKVTKQHGDYVELLICGKIKWYHCNDCGCHDPMCTEVVRRKP